MASMIVDLPEPVGPLEQEEAGAPDGGEVDDLGAGIRPDGRHGQVVQLHVTPPPAPRPGAGP